MSSLDQLSPGQDARLNPEFEFPQYVPPSRSISVLRRRKWLIAMIFFCVCAPAWLIIADLRPYFDAEASIMIDTRKSAFSDLQATVSNVTADALVLRTQSEIIRSRAISAKVVDRLDLVHAPEFQRLLDAKPSLTRQALQRVAAWLGLSQEATRTLTDAERGQAATNLLQEKLNVSNDGRSYIINVRARTSEAQLSASIANAYTNLYFDFNRQMKMAAITRVSALLDAQIALLQDRVREAENAVESFREKSGLVLNRTSEGVAGQGVTVANQQLAQVNAQLTVAAGDLAQKGASLRAVQSALRSGSGLNAIPEVVASPLIQRLREQETQLSSREASLNQTGLAQNPALLSAQAAIADVRRRIDAEVSKIVASLTNEVNAAKTRREALQQSLTQLQVQVTKQSQAGVMLGQLQSEAEAARTVYRDYLGRYQQTSNQAALQEPEANLISTAEAPLGRAGPPRLQFAALAGLGSLVAGAILALGLERLRGGIRTAEQLEAETGLLPLGFTPAMGRAENEARFSIYTQAVDLILGTLQHSGGSIQTRVVLVTSALPKEGKTRFAISLAASGGRSGNRALLIDCDVRRPAVASALKLPNQTLPSCPNHGAASRTVLRSNVLPGLDVMTFLPEGDGRLGMIGSDQIGALVEEARGRYGLIVLDTPPVLAFADAPVLASVTDGVILVVCWGRTPVASVLGALRTLQIYGVRILGSVLTQVRTRDLLEAEGAHGSTYRSYAHYFR